MARAHDVAAYLLHEGVREPLVVQKLLYYAQAWHLVWEGRPLFEDGIRAWDRGPVVGAVWHDLTRGALEGRAEALTSAERESVDVVRAFYGTLPGVRLSELTHVERPWADAYRPTRPSATISHEAMRAFYAQLTDAPSQKVIPASYQRGVAYMLSLSPDELEQLADPHEAPVDLDALARDAWPT